VKAALTPRARVTWPKAIEYSGYLLTAAAGVTLVFDPSPSGIVGFLSGVVASIGGWWSGRELSALQGLARGRTVDAAGRAAIIDWLREATKPERPIIIEAVSEKEPYALAAQLHGILVEAGWPVTPVDAGPAVGSPLIGLVIRTPPSGETTAGSHLEGALTVAGFGVRYVKSKNVKEGETVLAVGVKP
jgi:hypothetical protein